MPFINICASFNNEEWSQISVLNMQVLLFPRYIRRRCRKEWPFNNIFRNYSSNCNRSLFQCMFHILLYLPIRYRISGIILAIMTMFLDFLTMICVFYQDPSFHSLFLVATIGVIYSVVNFSWNVLDISIFFVSLSSLFPFFFV